MVDGDFSAAAGNWKGANGETITGHPGLVEFTVESSDGRKKITLSKAILILLMMVSIMPKIGLEEKSSKLQAGADGQGFPVLL